MEREEQRLCEGPQMPVKGVRLCPVGAASMVFKQCLWHLDNLSQLGVSGSSSILCLHEGGEPADFCGAESPTPTPDPRRRARERSAADLSAPWFHRLAVQEEVSTRRSWGTDQDGEGTTREADPARNASKPPYALRSGDQQLGRPRLRPWPTGRGVSGLRAPPPAPPRRAPGAPP